MGGDEWACRQRLYVRFFFRALSGGGFFFLFTTRKTQPQSPNPNPQPPSPPPTPRMPYLPKGIMRFMELVFRVETARFRFISGIKGQTSEKDGGDDSARQGDKQSRF